MKGLTEQGLSRSHRSGLCGGGHGPLRLQKWLAVVASSGTIPFSQVVADDYKEGRLPFDHEFDEDWYTRTYRDVCEEIKEGKVASAKQRYLGHGYSEGRLPGVV
jgi:hypothetical protein